jgi:SAM-dependent methyltransferase
MKKNPFDENYYKGNNQDKDRIALLWYAKLIKKLVTEGPSLDFGAGTGHLAKRLPMPSYALEIHETAKSAIEKNAPKTIFMTSLQEVVDSKMKFNIITALHVVEHINDRELNNILKQLGRILTKDGMILVSTPAENGIAHLLKKEKWLALSDPTHINIKNYDEWVKIFQTSGLHVVKSFADGFYDFPYGKLLHLRNIKFAFLTIMNLLSRTPFLKFDKGENNVFLLSNRIQQ